MSLLNLSLPALLTGLVALAAIIFLLQRLRVRYRQQTVITTLFWKEALEETRARVLTRRFRHPLAYLFVLLIAWLLWLGYADPQFRGEAERDYLILLDGSAGMGRGQRFQETVELVKARVGDLQSDRLRVFYCGAQPRCLLQPGENAMLLEARLEGLEPEACPASVDRTLRLLTSSLSQERETSILVAGVADVSQTTLDLLPEKAELRRLGPELPAAGGNLGITALGVAASSSGAWEQVDVLCVLHGVSPGVEAQLAVSLGGRRLEVKAERSREGTVGRILLPDLPATGELLRASLEGGDELAADDSATIRLPERKRIRVALDAGLAAAVGPVLSADRAVIVTNERPDLRVCLAGGGASDLPALEFVDIDSQEEAILLHHPPSQRSRQVLVESFTRLGLSEVDAMEVAQASGRQIAIGAAPAATRRISVWEPLLGESFNFVQSRSFPLFIAQAVRWLAEVEEYPPYVAAGEVLRGSSAVYVDEKGRKLDPVGASFVPPQAGIYRDASGDVLAASLLDPTTTGTTAAPPAAQLETASTDAGSRSGLDQALWLAVTILLLLCLEWYLFRGGRMP